MRRILLIGVLLTLSVSVRATLPVVDYAHIGQTVANEIRNIVQYAQINSNTLNTYLTCVRQWETALLQLAHIGDPALLRELLGSSEVVQLVSAGIASYQELDELKSLFNPATLESDVQNIMGEYRMTNWPGFTAANNEFVPADESAYRWDAARSKTAGSVTSMLQQIQQQRQQLQQRRADLVSQASNANDQSAVQKIHVAISAVDSSLADLDQRAHQAQIVGAQRQTQIGAAERMSNVQRAQQAQANGLQSIDQDPELVTLPSSIYLQSQPW